MSKPRFMAALAGLLLLCNLANAQYSVPKQTITGAEQPVQLGELVTLSVSKPEAVPNLATTSYEWKIFDGQKEREFKRDVDGNIFFGTGLQPKRFLAVVAITHVYVEKENTQVKKVTTRTVILTAVVTIEGVSPQPEPEPEPGPVEPSLSGLAKAVFKFATDTVPAGPDRSLGAKALATSFRNIATQVAAGTLKPPSGVLKATKESNDKAMDKLGLADEWGPWSDLLQEKLIAMYEAGELESAKSWADAWREIANGLEQVK